ncbi:hypothetical protein ABIB25_002740 [Nakamurella sp. UYEF19]|uniref:hypothetical protein n=1 Tax=Nakamurella sp. UYEF19 TaxID=1756392 RepID=UPI0033948497
MGVGRTVVAVAATTLAVKRLRRLALRSGVSDAEVAAVLPGDDLLPGATDVIDRAITLPASAETVWPWLVQLGKKRAGWYFSRRLGRLLPARGRGLWRIDPQWQHLQVGDLIPDWGPGDPSFRAEQIDPGRALVYLSLRDKQINHRWPDDEERNDLTAISWALVLTDLGNHSRLHIRLKMRLGRARLITGTLGGLIDWLTIVWLFGGLTERVRPQP